MAGTNSTKKVIHDKIMDSRLSNLGWTWENLWKWWNYGVSIINKKEVLWKMVRQFFKENKDLEKSDNGPPLESVW